MTIFLFFIWTCISLNLLWRNFDLIEELDVWRSVALTVTLIIFAPVFFIYDLAVLFIDIITEEIDDEEENCD